MSTTQDNAGTLLSPPPGSQFSVISLGAGVQSSTMALMAAHGEITPMPECAIFADTQAEPESVYRWLDWLEPKLPFPVHRVTKGNLGEAALRVRTSKAGNKYSQHTIPAFISTDRGAVGLLMRQCTQDFKIDMLMRKVRELRKGRDAVQWIGISLDEIHRMKPSRLPYVEHRWPLIDLRMRRYDCLRWMKSHGYTEPPRSACVFCPYHSNAEWRRLRDDEPEAFERAAQFERDLQETARAIGEWRGVPFLHRSLVPLETVDLAADSHPDLFGNECEGMCGV